MTKEKQLKPRSGDGSQPRRPSSRSTSRNATNNSAASGKRAAASSSSNSSNASITANTGATAAAAANAATSSAVQSNSFPASTAALTSTATATIVEQDPNSDTETVTKAATVTPLIAPTTITNITALDNATRPASAVSISGSTVASPTSALSVATSSATAAFGSFMRTADTTAAIQSTPSIPLQTLNEADGDTKIRVETFNSTNSMVAPFTTSSTIVGNAASATSATGKGEIDLKLQIDTLMSDYDDYISESEQKEKAAAATAVASRKPASTQPAIEFDPDKSTDSNLLLRYHIKETRKLQKQVIRLERLPRYLFTMLTAFNQDASRRQESSQAALITVFNTAASNLNRTQATTVVMHAQQTHEQRQENKRMVEAVTTESRVRDKRDRTRDRRTTVATVAKVATYVAIFGVSSVVAVVTAPTLGVAGAAFTGGLVTFVSLAAGVQNVGEGLGALVFDWCNRRKAKGKWAASCCIVEDITHTPAASPENSHVNGNTTASNNIVSPIHGVNGDTKETREMHSLVKGTNGAGEQYRVQIDDENESTEYRVDIAPEASTAIDRIQAALNSSTLIPTSNGSNKSSMPSKPNGAATVVGTGLSKAATISTSTSAAAATNTAHGAVLATKPVTAKGTPPMSPTPATVSAAPLLLSGGGSNSGNSTPLIALASPTVTASATIPVPRSQNFVNGSTSSTAAPT